MTSPAIATGGRADCLYRCEFAEIYHADSLDPEVVAEVMGERKADLLCFDAPYSERTHQGHDSQVKSLKTSFARNHKGRPSREQAYALRVERGESAGRRAIDYPPWAGADVTRFLGAWESRCSGWFVTITDHVLASDWCSGLGCADRLVFPPLPLVETGSRVRMSGDGPSNWTCWLVVARPRAKVWTEWGSLRGAYIVPGEREQNSADGTDRIVGGKPKRAMIEIVGDYSREGDLVVDPTCGAATTGIAALRTGRRFIGIEKDRATAELAAEIIKAERSHSTRRRMVAGQTALFQAKETT